MLFGRWPVHPRRRQQQVRVYLRDLTEDSAEKVPGFFILSTTHCAMEPVLASLSSRALYPKLWEVLVFVFVGNEPKKTKKVFLAMNMKPVSSLLYACCCVCGGGGQHGPTPPKDSPRPTTTKVLHPKFSPSPLSVLSLLSLVPRPIRCQRRFSKTYANALFVARAQVAVCVGTDSTTLCEIERDRERERGCGVTMVQHELLATETLKRKRYRTIDRSMACSTF